MTAPTLGALVLAGGRSTRMGRDKASLPIGGSTMLARTVATLASVVDEVVVVARAVQALPPVDGGEAAVVRHAHDDVEDRGPVGGLVAGLAASTRDVVFASSCDVPFLAPAFVRAVVDALGDADVAIPEAEGRLHPLAAAYRRTAVLPVARALLDEGRLRPVYLLERLRHVVVPEATLRGVDPALDSLRNVNTPEELAEAVARSEARGDAVPRVTVELFGIAARRAGRAEVVVHAATLGAALVALERACPRLAGEVVTGGRLAPHWVASVDGRRFVDAPDVPLPDGARVLVLSSLAGG
jgi:molybdenum cofactor guanylyltransferase